MSTTKSGKYRNLGGFRPTFDWESESREEVKMGATMKNMSATLRKQSQEVEAFAYTKAKASEDRVNSALKSHMGKLTLVKDALENEVDRTDITVTKLDINRERTLKQLTKQKMALDLNQRRLQVRETRPGREKTHDEVQARLIAQQRAIQSNIDKLTRCVSTNAKDTDSLRCDRAGLAADLMDKTAALDVDTELYDTTKSTERLHAVTHKPSTTYPHQWLGSSESEMRRVRTKQNDAQRLRGAIGTVINETKTTSREIDSQLRSALRSKIASTEKLMRSLEAELAAVNGELAAADTRRQQLEQALEDKQEPLALGRQRYEMRHARPDREKVADEVEGALASEFNDLNYVCSQLEKKIALVKGEIARLTAHAASLQANINDKAGALVADRAVLHLDDNIDTVSEAATSIYAHSAVSRASGASRADAMDRIAKLEAELDSVRAGRMKMEEKLKAHGR